jgi:hypothetical protein
MEFKNHGSQKDKVVLEHVLHGEREEDQLEEHKLQLKHVLQLEFEVSCVLDKSPMNHYDDDVDDSQLSKFL